MARPSKIPFWTKFNFGFGQIGEAAFSAITLTFVSLYYNQALGLNIHLVGWALVSIRKLLNPRVWQYSAQQFLLQLWAHFLTDSDRDGADGIRPIEGELEE